MLSNYNKNKIIDRFNQHKIIFCGDVGYQLDPVYSPYEYEKNLIGNFKPEYYEKIHKEHKYRVIADKPDNEYNYFDVKKIDIPTINHDVMHRCKCPILKHNLLMLRKILSNRKIDRIAENELNSLINGKVVDKDNIDYKIEDYIITNTHKKKDAYSEKYKDILKYYITQNTRDYCNGEIVLI